MRRLRARSPRNERVRTVGWGDAAEIAVAEPVAVAFEGYNVGVVDDPVDHGGGDDVVTECIASAAELLVGGDDQAGVLFRTRKRSIVTGPDWLLLNGSRSILPRPEVEKRTPSPSSTGKT